MPGRRLNQTTEILDGSVTGGLYLIGYDPSVATGDASAVRFQVDSLGTYLGTGGGGGVVANITLACSDDGTNHVLTVVKDAGTGAYILSLNQSDAGGAASTLTLTCADDATDHAVTVVLDSGTGQYILNIAQ